MHRVLLAAIVLLGLDIVPATPAWSQEVVFSDSFECIFFEDADADQFGNPLFMLTGCPRPLGFVHDDSDCDDGSIDTFPGAAPNDSAFACMRDLDFDDYGESNPPPQVMAGSDCDDLNVFLNPGATETCDGIDNNCDGSVDEDFLAGGSVTHTGLDGLVGVKGDACGSGTCAGGTVICGGDSTSLACDTEALAELELCDGIDNDCDGSVDDGNPGGGGACNTGLLGQCDAGTQACQSGTLACFQDIFPSTEVCDNLDNDCDGAIDDGNPGGGGSCSTGLPGVCSAGTTSCTGGALQCFQDDPGSPEICDGLDNNCDGQIDEGCEIAGVRIHFPSGAIVMSATGQLSIEGSVGQTPAGPADSGSGHHVYWGFRAGLEQ